MDIDTGGVPSFVFDGIVAAELVLPSGTGVTLRLEPDAPLEAQDSRHFLGRGRQVYCFRTVEELAAFVAEGGEHTLSHRPAWGAVRKASPDDLVPAAIERHDLVGLTQRLRDGTAFALDARLADALDVVSDIAEQCELADVEALLDTDSPFWQAVEQGRVDADTGARLAADWERIVAAVDRAVGWPLVALPAALSRRGGLPARSVTGERLPLEEVAPLEVLWLGLGEYGEGYTLRERTESEGDPDQRWLGGPGTLLLAASLEDLAAHVTTGEPAAVGDLPGVASLRGRDDLDWEPYEDCVVDLGEVPSLLDAGADTRPGGSLVRDRAERVVTAYWHLLLLAQARGFDDVLALLDEGTPTGHAVMGAFTDVLEDAPGALTRLREAPLDRVRDDWLAALDALAARVRWL